MNYVEAVSLAAQIKVCPAFASGSRITDELNRFLAHKKKHETFSRHTGEWAASPIRQLATFLANKKVDAVRQEDLLEFRVHLRKTLAETSTASYMRAVQSFFSWLLSQQKICASPFAGLVLPKVTQAARIRFCSRDLRDRLIKDAPTWELKYILHAGMHGGMRKNEQIEAIPEWFDLERGFFTVKKTATFRAKDRELRTVPMTTEFLAFMRSTPMATPFLLKPNVKHGNAIFRYDYRAPFENYVKAMGCGWVTRHVMRHTFGAQ